MVEKVRTQNQNDKLRGRGSQAIDHFREQNRLKGSPKQTEKVNGIVSGGQGLIMIVDQLGGDYQQAKKV